MAATKRICPWWIGYLMANPLRRLFQRPEDYFEPWVGEGSVVADIGCAMGYFSLPMARAVGPTGRVVCVDIQERMLSSLRRRARRADLEDRLELRLCREGGFALDGLEGQVDFALACYMVHEVPDPRRLFSEAHQALKCGGQMLVSEPAGHVSKRAFAAEIELAREVGFEPVSAPEVRRSRTALLRK